MINETADSPAICPLDWTAVATFTSISSLFDNTGFVTIRPGTTAILCCPSYEFAFTNKKVSKY